MVTLTRLAGLRPLIRRLYWAVTPAVHGMARPVDVSDPSAAVPFAYDVALSDAAPRVCVVCHLFYDDLAPQMRRDLSSIPFPFDLFVSTSDELKRDRIASVFADLGKGGVDVRVAPNRGRDIAPKLVTFSDVYDRFEYVLFVHGKKSMKSSVGEQWRNTLIDGLVGSPATVISIMAMFQRHPDLGIVMVQHFEAIRPHLHWDHVYGKARQLARRMGFDLTPKHVLDLPSGSMFWARTRALAPLLALNLSYQDFPVEKGQTRRTLHHAIERLFLFAAERSGYRWVKIADPRHYSARTPLATITGPDALDAFVAASSFSLLESHRR